MRKLDGFQKWAVATTIATYILILIGGLVRASDAGLGCPDWPTCFGKPYPPFSYSELLTRDVPSDFDIENYDVRLAWIEWTNRLSGTVIGLLVIGTVAHALKDHRGNKRILYPTLTAFGAVLFNGWLGGIVIESRLEPLVISAHLLFALIQVSLLLYAAVSAFYPEGGIPKGSLPPKRETLARGALVVLLLALIQVSFGAVLRGQLEDVEENNPEMARGELIHDTNPYVDGFHRSFSWIVMAGVLWLGWYAHTRIDFNPYLRYGTQIIGLLVLVQVGAGIGLAYAGLPPPLQAAHLVIASLLFGGITLVYLLATRLPIAERSLTQSYSQQAAAD